MVLIFKDLVFIEKKRIFKTKDNFFNFNPIFSSKPKHRNWFNKFINQTDDTKIMDRVKSTGLLEMSINLNSLDTKVFSISPKNIKKFHYTKIVCYEEDTNEYTFKNSIGFNHTISENIKLYNPINEVIKPSGSYSLISKPSFSQKFTPPYIFKNEDIIIDYNKIYDMNDIRVAAENYSLNDIYLIFSAGFEKTNKYYSLGSFGLEEKIYPKKSSLLQYAFSNNEKDKPIRIKSD
jgi:hypothetical protein